MNHGLRIESLTVRIPLLGGSVVHAASDIDLDVQAGTVTALVGGESGGCGKSIIATSVMNMLPPNASRTGTVTVGTPDLEIDVFSGAAFRGRHVALVPQSAATHLTPPVRTARSQLQETIDALGSDHTCDAWHFASDSNRRPWTATRTNCRAAWRNAWPLPVRWPGIRR